MAEFKLCIADPKTGKCYQKDIKDQETAPFIGLNIGESIKGEVFGMGGYEFQITGGSDYCGFPMRKGILGIRKKIQSYGGVGFKTMKKGEKKRKTVCGHKINEKIVQINLKITKEGSKKLAEIFPDAEKKLEEKAKEKSNKAPKKEEEKEEKPAEMSETKKVSEHTQKSKISDEPREEKKEQPKKEEKPKESAKEEKHKEKKEAPKKEEKLADKPKEAAKK